MKKVLIFLFIVASITSCKKEVLELEPLSELGANEFYQNSDDLELAIIAAYDGLQNVPLREFAITEMRSDNSKSKSSEGDWGEFENFTVAPTNQTVGSYWSANYNVIFRANTVLENLEVVSQADLKSKFEGEAKFIRALSYFNLVRAYGDVPLVDKTIAIDESDYFDRDPSSTILDFITADLEDAVVMLPSKASMTFGRATSGAAKGLLAKVSLTTGDYGRAETLTAELIADTEYELESNYADIFYSEGNDEILFAIPYINDDINESQDFSFEMTAGGVRAGLNYLTDDFIANINEGDSVRSAVYRNQSNIAECGKYLTTSANARLCGNDWIVLRLADVYLMYVEAAMAGSESTVSITAIEAYNSVRERANMSTVTTDGTGEITLEMLLNERRYELSFENHRLYDLIRTGQAIEVLGAFAESEGYQFGSRDLLLPIPQGEINVSDGLLLQNPGY